MKQIFTEHAIVRKQQRGIPPLIANWLIDYGDEEFDGHAARIGFQTGDEIIALEVCEEVMEQEVVIVGETEETISRSNVRKTMTTVSLSW